MLSVLMSPLFVMFISFIAYDFVVGDEMDKVTGLGYARGVVKTDNLYVVTDPGVNQLNVYDLSWSLVRTIGSFGSADGQLDGPDFVAVMGSNVMVADYWNNRVSLFNPSDGTFIRHLLTEVDDGIEEPSRMFYVEPSLWLSYDNSSDSSEWNVRKFTLP